MNTRFALDDSVVKEVMSEGWVIAAWVSVWEGLAALLMNLGPLSRTRKVYQRLVRGELVFGE